MKSICLCWAILVLAMALGDDARQGHAPVKPSASTQNQQDLGVVVGRVFAITKSGDLKPCRLCKVYLFFSLPIVGQKVVDAKAETPGEVFLLNQLEQLKVIGDASKAEMTRSDKMISAPRSHPLSEEEAASAARVSAELRCKSLLIGDTKAILDTFERADQHNQSMPIYSADADEEGNFQLSKIKSGEYILVALGQAGMNDAFWQENVQVHLREKVTVKLSSVKTACLKTD